MGAGSIDSSFDGAAATASPSVPTGSSALAGCLRKDGYDGEALRSGGRGPRATTCINHCRRPSRRWAEAAVAIPIKNAAVTKAQRKRACRRAAGTCWSRLAAIRASVGADSGLGRGRSRTACPAMRSIRFDWSLCSFSRRGTSSRRALMTLPFRAERDALAPPRPSSPQSPAGCSPRGPRLCARASDRHAESERAP